MARRERDTQSILVVGTGEAPVDEACLAFARRDARVAFAWEGATEGRELRLAAALAGREAIALPLDAAAPLDDSGEPAERSARWVLRVIEAFGRLDVVVLAVGLVTGGAAERALRAGRALAPEAWPSLRQARPHGRFLVACAVEARPQAADLLDEIVAGLAGARGRVEASVLGLPRS